MNFTIYKSARVYRVFAAICFLFMGTTASLAQGSYCLPLSSFNCQFGDNIGNFSTSGGVTNISNLSSGCSSDGYSYDSVQVLTVVLGESFDLEVGTGGVFNQGFALWVDWNNDFDFDDDGEAMWNSGSWSSFPFNASIEIPASLSTGNFRMRVRCSYNSLPTSACAQQTYGEVEDYNITILAGNEALGVCYGDVPPVFVNMDSVTGGSGNYAFLWQLSTDLGNTWSTAPGTNDSINYDFGQALFDTTQFRRRVVDLVCADTAYSSIIEAQVPDSLKLDSTLITNVTCNGLNDGAIQVYISGGAVPHSYSWSNQDSVKDIDSLAAGTYTLTVTDRFGCEIIESFVINEASPISVSMVVDNNPSCQGFTDGGLSATPSGGRTPYTYLWNTGDTTQSINNIGAGTYSVILTDSSGCIAMDTITLSDLDTIPPTVVAQDVDVYLDANGNGSIGVQSIDNGSSDACGLQISYISKNSFSCSDLGANTVTLFVTDVNGNTDSAQAIVTVYDTISPIAIAQNITAYLGANGSVVISPAMADGGSSDNCSFTLALSQDTFDCGDEGLNLEVLTITDTAGNSSSASFLIDIQDTISPTLLTKTITVQLGATGQASIAPSQLDSASFDNCSNQLFYSASKTSFNCSDLGINTLTITITDNQGNTTNGLATVIVEDNLAPTVQAQNISLQLNANGEASVSAMQMNNGSSDNCGIDSMWVSRTNFNCNDLGQNAILFTVRDASGNESSSNLVVTIEDMISPTVVTRDISINLDANGQASITAVMIDSASSDNCGISSMSLNKLNFDCSNLGANTVNLTVTDSSGNSASGIATVTISDVLSPSVLTQDISIQLDATGMANITPSMIDNGSSDNCSISNMSLDVSTFSCSDISTPVQVSLTVTDNSNNTSSATAMVTVQDVSPPLVQAQNLTIYLDAMGNASITSADVDNGSSDNCGVVNTSLDINVFDCADLGQNLITLTAIDASGNSAQQNAFITVLDTINPSIDNLPATITAYTGANQCGTTVQWPTLTASDNCGSTFINTSQINGGLFNKGTTTVIVNVSDASGNSISNSFDVVVVDTVSPVITGVPTFFTTTPNVNSCDAVVSWNPPTAFDNCASVTLTSTHASGGIFPVGTTQITYTATDADANSSSVSFDIIVSDVVDPIINNTPTDITQTADVGSCGATVSFVDPTVSDNCSGAILLASHTSGSMFPIGTTTVNYTATDAAGNTSVSSFNIIITDDEKPTVLSVFAGDTVGPCDAAYSYPMPTATDNCGPVTVSLVSGLPSSNVFPVGITQNTFRISDSSGNDTLVSFTIVVVPQGQPQLPSLIEICLNAPSVDIALGQNMVWTGAGAVNNGTVFDPAQAGVGRHLLSYNFTDDQACVATGTISITVLPAPSDPVIVQTASTTLSTSVSYATYQWYRDGIAIPGATNQTYSYTQGGNYQVEVGNTSGCVVYGEGFVIGLSGGSIGIEEFTLQDLDVYPNPTEGQLIVQIQSSQEEQLQLSIYSMDGKKVYSQTQITDDAGKVRVDLSNLPKAIYLLQVQNGGESAIERIVLY